MPLVDARCLPLLIRVIPKPDAAAAPSLPPAPAQAPAPASPGVDLDALAAAGAERIAQRGAAVREPPQQQRGLKQRNGLLAFVDALSGLFSMFMK